MIKLIKEGHNDICGGYSYSGYATFEGATVKEVLEEIKEFAKDSGNDIGEGFGKPGKDSCGCWGIKINDIPYVGGWVGWRNEYNHEYDDEKVIEVTINGGWYCFYDFYIISEKTKKTEKVSDLDEEKKAMKLFKFH